IGGSPHAAVAWLVIDRSSPSASTPGSAWSTSPHTGSEACGPGGTLTGAAHPARIATASTPSTRRLTTFTVTRPAALPGRPWPVPWRTGPREPDGRYHRVTAPPSRGPVRTAVAGAVAAGPREPDGRYHRVTAPPSRGPARTTVAGTVAAVTDPREPTIVADLSETELIARFTPLLPRGRATVVPTGDDAAVVAAPDGRFVVSTDVLVEDHHFRRGWGSARDVGARAAAQNLADVVAMGAVPTSMVVGTVLPPTTPLEWVLDLARGLADVCAPLGVGVDGGDLSAGEQVVVAVTVHGDLEGRAPVLRSGARPGDVVAHAGAIGRATAGYAVLATGSTSDDPEAAVAVGAFLRPTPPYALGPAAAEAGATAMMDVSDGLLRDAGRMARASGVGLVLDPVAES